MDLASIIQFFDIASKIVTTIATPLAICAALLGLRTWRHQLKGNTEYELARRYLKGVFRVRDSFRIVRSPMMYPPVQESDPNGALSDRQKQFRQDQRKEYGRRLQELQKSWSELEVEVLEAEVLWGESAKDAVKPLRECIAELATTIAEYFWLNDPPAYATVDRNAERVARVDRTIYHISEDPTKDEFWGKILQAVKVAEKFIQPKLKV